MLSFFLSISYCIISLWFKLRLSFYIIPFFSQHYLQNAVSYLLIYRLHWNKIVVQTGSSELEDAKWKSPIIPWREREVKLIIVHISISSSRNRKYSRLELVLRYCRWWSNSPGEKWSKKGHWVQLLCKPSYQQKNQWYNHPQTTIA